MKRRSLSTSAEYHEALSDRYNQRKATISKAKLKTILQTLGFYVELSDIEESRHGVNNRTFLTNDLVIKIRDDVFSSRKSYKYFASKVVSDHFYPKLPVVNVLAYDHFDKTDYKVLVMKRRHGTVLIDGFLEMSPEVQKNFYRQLIRIGRKVAELKFDDWGDIRNHDRYESFSRYLVAKVKKYCAARIEKNLVSAGDVLKIEKYFMDHHHIFDNEKESHFAHTDLTIANVLYEGDKITLLYDFDSALKGPEFMILPMLIASIDNLGIIVDGTRYYKSYQHQKFEHLYPVLREEMKKVLSDPNIVAKMNLVLISRGLRIVSEDRFHGWNKVIIDDILDDELVEDGSSYENTYYGKIFDKMMKYHEPKDKKSWSWFNLLKLKRRS